MKLAEALLERAQAKKDCSSLLDRIQRNALVQEGEEPGEDPLQLIPQYEAKKTQLLTLIQRINATNASTPFNDSETMADALARRDVLSERITAYRMMYSSCEIRQSRMTASEIRIVRCMDPAKLQEKIAQLAKEYRELDTALQSLNWTVDLK